MQSNTHDITNQYFYRHPMKSVIEHMAYCQHGRQCPYPHCASSRQIIMQWNNCVKDDYPGYKPADYFNNGNVHGPSIYRSSLPVPSYNEYDNSFDPFRSHNPPNRAASGFQASSAMGFHPSSHSVVTLGPTNMPYGRNMGMLPPPPDPPSQPKEWHAHISKDLRNHLVSKLVEAIFPLPVSVAMQDQRIKDLISYARKVEKELFELASNKEEYYHLVAEKIYKIQKEWQEKENRRLEQNHQRVDSVFMSNIQSAASIKYDIQKGSKQFQQQQRQKMAQQQHLHQPSMPVSSDNEMNVNIKPNINPVIKVEKVKNNENKYDIKPKPEEIPKKKDTHKKEYPKDPVRHDPEMLRKMLLSVWKDVDSIEEASPFRVPVDPEALQIPDYFDVIKNPMDLLTIRSKIDSYTYKKPREFCNDMWLMFNNAWIYNKKNSKVYKYCTKLNEVFVEKMNPVMEKLGYCCSNMYNFTPLALFCFGAPVCVIARDQPYYLYETNSSKFDVNLFDRHIFCPKCFDNLPPEGVNLNENPNEPPNYISKDKFIECKNDKIDAEPFEKCKICDREWHTICANFNKKVFPEGFICKTCRREKDIPKPENKFSAKKLPHCKLSTYIENRVNNFIRKKCNTVKRKHEVIIRVLCSTDKEVEVKTAMKKRYVPQGFPEKFPYRTKAIFAFEVVDGVEICFFGLHVQEYGSECPEPNRRRVYIAYLDSVHFFQPRELRTDVYHEILLSYLNYVKNLGYTMAHIWACSPSEGDDYIFHCHPPEQKIPRPKRLQVWYKKMLEKGQSNSILYEFNDIYKQATDENLRSPMSLPYFDGDYWPDVIEDCINDVDKEEAERKMKEDLIDDEDDIYTLDDSREKVTPNKKVKSSKKSANLIKKKRISTGNEVTDKLYEMLEKHKDIFFTIKLHSPKSELNVLQKPIEDPDPLMPSDLMDSRDTFLTRAREEHWEFSSLRRAKYSTLSFCYAVHTLENHYSCNYCDRNATWSCKKCDDFDLCDKCHDEGNHYHHLEKIRFQPPENFVEEPEDTKKDLLQKAVMSYVHAYQCRDMNCRLSRCAALKKAIQHSKNCKDRFMGKCGICKGLSELCYTHAIVCRKPECSIPNCQQIRKSRQEKKNFQNRRNFSMQQSVNNM